MTGAEPGREAAPLSLVLDRRYWLLALIPLGVLVLMYEVLDATRREDVVFTIIAAAEFPSVAAAEARYRSFWVAAFLLAAAASAAVAASAALCLWHLPLARDRKPIAAIILVIVTLVVLNETVGERGAVRWYDAMGEAVTAPADQSSAEDGDSAALPEPTPLFRTLFETPPEGVEAKPVLHLLDNGLDAVKILGTIALTLTGAGLVLSLARPLEPQPIEREAALLAAALQRQKALLQHATIVYVLAIVAMLAWMHWPLPYLADKAAEDAYRELLVGNALVQGTGYSLGLASLYLPPALILHRRITDLAETGPATKHDWLKEKGLATRPFDQLRELATVLLPAILSLIPTLEKLWN